MDNNTRPEAYEDIIHLPHHVSKKRPRMPLKDRAAQFSPFAAVVGHESAVKEAARKTEKRKELDEMEKAIIDDQLRRVEMQIENHCEVLFVYFQPDGMKEGGAYLEKRGEVKKIDPYTRVVLLLDGTVIPIDEIISVVIGKDSYL